MLLQFQNLEGKIVYVSAPDVKTVTPHTDNKTADLNLGGSMLVTVKMDDADASEITSAINRARATMAGVDRW